MKHMTKKEYEEALNRSFETKEEKDSFERYAYMMHEKNIHCNRDEARLIGKRNY